MAPAKFDDISKTAASVLNDDFQCKTFELKSKQVTKFAGATSELNVELFPKGSDVKTPAKFTFKIPKPFPMLDGVSIDKLELDKTGGFKLETSLGKALHTVDGLKIEVKSDLKNALTYASTYTGIADTTVKLETKHSAPTDFTAECVHGHGSAVIGAQFKGTTNLCPAVGVSFQQGDIFASVIAKNMFSEFTAHGLYKVSKDIKVAATYQQGGKTSGSWAIGGAASINKDLTAKAKVESTNKVSIAIKKDLVKGVTFLGGVNCGFDGSGMVYGAKINIE